MEITCLLWSRWLLGRHEAASHAAEAARNCNQLVIFIHSRSSGRQGENNEEE